MSASFDLATARKDVHQAARTDAGAAVILAERHAARHLARHLGLPDARYAVSNDGVHLPAGWREAERILIVPPQPSGGDLRILPLERAEAAPVEPEFGLAGAEEGRLVEDPSSSAVEAIAVSAGPLASGLAQYHLAAEALHLAIVQGGLDGFLDQARAFLKTRSSPWYGAGIARATDDPHALRTLGLLFSRRHALDALADDAFAAVAGALAGGDPSNAADRVDLARHYGKRIGRALVNEGIGLLGASSASGRHGFDRFWRDIAAHGLRYPPRRDAEALARDFIIETRTAP